MHYVTSNDLFIQYRGHAQLCPYSVAALTRKAPGLQNLWQVVEEVENMSL